MIDFLKREPISNRWAAIVPLVYMAMVLWCDYSERGAMIVSPMAMIGLLILALFLQTAWMTVWVIAYAIMIFGILKIRLFFKFVAGDQPMPSDLSIYLGLGSFVSVGLFCIIFTLLLNGLRQTISELSGLISIIPNPIVASDSRGKILFCNGKLLRVMGLKRKDLVGQGYFGFFAPKNMESKTITSYMNRFEGESLEEPLSLRINDTAYWGETQMLKQISRSIMITIFKEREIARHHQS